MSSGLKIFILSAASIIAASCTDSLQESGPGCGAGENAADKIVNTPVSSVPGILLFYSEDEDILVSGDFRSAMDETGALSAGRAFPSVSSGEGSGRLACWYSVTFQEDTDLESAAVKLASVGGIAKVQFNSRLVKSSDCRSWPVASDLMPQYTSRSRAAASGYFNDRYLNSQWNYRNIGSIQIAQTIRAGADINVTDAWRISGGDPRVIVAVVDEGIEYSHPDLSQNMWTNMDEIPGNGIDDDRNGYVDDYYGCNFVADKSQAGNITWKKRGDSGHATHIAGTIAAVNNNGRGVCGVAGGTGAGDGVRIMTCQVFDGNDGGDALTCADAIIYAADNGASVLSCSFGFAAGTYTSDSAFLSDGESGVEADAIDYFISRSNCEAVDGGIAIFASGNDMYPMANYPGAYRGCVSVSGIACDNLPAFYTNYGPGCDISAPGGERYTGGQDKDASCILSTMPTESFPLYSGDNYLGETAAEYGYMQGTSMACPHVSGIAALGLSYALQTGRHFTREEFISMLLSSVDGIDGYLEGTKTTMTNIQTGTIGPLTLARYRGNMGTGVADAWRFLMNIEGTPYVTVPVGKTSEINLGQYLGGNAAWLKDCTVSISETDRQALGLRDEPVVSDGVLTLTPLRTGSAKLSVRHLSGGSSEESIDSPSGMPVVREISVIARENVSGNGGWL